MVDIPVPKSGSQQGVENIYPDMIKPAPYMANHAVDSYEMERNVNATILLSMPLSSIIARPYQDHYEILHGYDAYLAFIQAFPNSKVPLLVSYYHDDEAVLIAIKINAQRFDVSVIDEAEAYQTALHHFNWKPGKLAEALDIARSTVVNRLRLLDLDEDVQDKVRKKLLLPEIAKTLCALPSQEQIELANKAILRGWDTRTLYKAAHPGYKPKTSENKKTPTSQDVQSAPDINKDQHTLHLEQQISEIYGAPITVDVDSNNKYKGEINTRFFSLSELSQILERIQGQAQHDLSFKGTLTFTIEHLDHLDQVVQGFMPSQDF